MMVERGKDESEEDFNERKGRAEALARELRMNERDQGDVDSPLTKFGRVWDSSYGTR